MERGQKREKKNDTTEKSKKKRGTKKKKEQRNRREEWIMGVYIRAFGLLGLRCLQSLAGVDEGVDEEQQVEARGAHRW